MGSLILEISAKQYLRSFEVCIQLCTHNLLCIKTYWHEHNVNKVTTC